MDSSKIATLGSPKPPTIASRRPMLTYQKSFSVLSINTSATHKDLLRRNSSATTSRQRRLQTPTNIPPLPLSAHSAAVGGNMSPEELSSKIADSFQQFSSMLSQLSSNKSPNNATTATTISSGLATPVTPPLSHSSSQQQHHTTIKNQPQQQHNPVILSPSPLTSPHKSSNKTLVPADTINAMAAATQSHQRKEVRSLSHPNTAINATVIQKGEVPSSSPVHTHNNLESNLPQVKHLRDSTCESESEEAEEEEYKEYLCHAIYFENAFSTSPSTKKAINIKGNTTLRRRLLSKWLTRAASVGDLDAMQQMLDTIEDMDVNCTDDKKTGVTSLMYASYFGHVQCLNLLLKQKSIRVNQQDKKGWTALMWAVNSNQKEIVQILLDHGAEKSLETVYGRNVFHYPTPSTVKELLGIPPTSPSKSNSTKGKQEEKDQKSSSSNSSHDGLGKAKLDSRRVSSGSNTSNEIDYYAVDGYSHFLNNHNSGGASTSVDPGRKSISGSSTTKALSPPDFSQLTKAILSPRQQQEQQNKKTTPTTSVDTAASIPIEEDEEEMKRWEASIKSSNTFSWNQCLPDQMFVFSQDHMHLILDQALNVTDIKSLMNKHELDNDLWQPANIIFLSARFVHYCSSRDLLNSLLNTVAAKLTRVIKAIYRDTQALAYWIANMCQLSSYLKKDPGLSVSTQDAQEVLSELISEAYSHFITESQKRIDKILEPCMMEYEQIHELEQVDFVDDWQRFFRRSSSNYSRKSMDTVYSNIDRRLSVDSTSTTSSSHMASNITTETATSPSTNSASSPQSVTKLLTQIQSTLQAYHVPPAIVIQAVAQFFHYLSCELFNRVLTYKKYLCRSKALQIRMNLSAMEDWVRMNELPTSLINAFEPLVQLLQLLQCLSQMNDIILFTSTVQTFDKLNPLQMKRCVQNYRYEVSEPKLPEEVEQLASQMVLNHQHQRMMAANNSDNSRRNSSSSIISTRASMDNIGIGTNVTRGSGGGGSSRPASISSLNCLLTTTANKKRLSAEELLSLNSSLLIQQLDDYEEDNMEVEEKRNSKYLLPFSIPVTTALLQGWTEEKHKKFITSTTAATNYVGGGDNSSNYSDALYQEIKLRKQEQQSLLDKIYPSISEEWLYNLDRRLHVR